MSAARARALLESLGHREVLERLPAAQAHETGALAGRALAAFRLAHAPSLSRALRFAPRGAAIRGRALWLLGEAARAREELAGIGGAEALAYLGAAFLAPEPRRAEAVLSRALALAPALAEARLWRAAARLEDPRRAAEALRDLDEHDAARGASVCSLLLRAMAESELRRWARAAEAAEGLIALEPGCQAGWAFRFQARLGLGEERGAESDYHAARDRDPECGAFYQLDEDLPGGLPARMDERLRYFERAIKRRPGLVMLRAAYAEALRERGVDRFDLALREYRALEPRLGRQAWFQAFYARAEAPVAGLEASLERLDRACRLYPEGGWLFAWRGETLRRLGRVREALRDLERAARLQPWYGYARAWRGAALLQLGRVRAARASLDEGLSLSITAPADAQAYHLRSLCRARTGDWAGAIEDRTAAFTRDPKYVLLSERAGRAEASVAARLLRACGAARSSDPWTAAWRGQALLAGKRFTEAETALGRVVRRAPAHAWARLWRAEAREALGRLSGAEADLRAALRAAPGLWRAGERLAALLAQRGKLRPALAVLDRCAAARPSSARFHALRADLLRRTGRPADAAEAARAALALDARFTGARAILAAALAESGRPDEAAIEAGRAAREDRRVAEALERLA